MQQQQQQASITVVKVDGMRLRVVGGSNLDTTVGASCGFMFGGRLFEFNGVHYDSTRPDVREADAIDAEYRRRHSDLDQRRRGAPYGSPLGHYLPKSCRLTSAEQRRWDDYYGECGFHWGTHWHLPVPTAEQVKAWRRRRNEADHANYVRTERIRDEARRAANSAASTTDWYKRTCFNSSLTEDDVQAAATAAWRETKARLEAELPPVETPVHPALA